MIYNLQKYSVGFKGRTLEIYALGIKFTKPFATSRYSVWVLYYTGFWNLVVLPKKT